MKGKYITTLALFLALSNGAMAQRHEVFSPDVRSLQVVCGSKWLEMPVMNLNEWSDDNVMNISFDDLTHTYRRYTYSIEHCEADWSTSTELFQSDYVEGFAQDNTIDDVEESINTNVLYTHYKFCIPNENCQLKLSGNYRITVVDDNTGEKILTACFMVVDSQVGISMNVETNTDIDINKSHQQIEMALNYNNLRVVDPAAQIKTVVLQNGRWDNAKVNAKAQYSTLNGLQWTHNRDLIFDAGNEYHKFETLSTSHATMGIDHISWDGQNYHAAVFTDEPRPNYLTDEDANGSFIIRNSDNVEIDNTCEYMLVDFTLKCPHPVAEDVYLNGTWTNGRFLPEYRMNYDNANRCYRGQVLLKQGYYSYQYLTLKADGTTGIMPTEGSFYQTENKYQTLVYYRPQGGRTDQLVGYQKVQYK